jgi:hypothetical protein
MIGKGDDPGARGAVAGDLEKIKKNERNGMPPVIKGCYIDVTERRLRQATGNGNAAAPRLAQEWEESQDSQHQPW